LPTRILHKKISYPDGSAHEWSESLRKVWKSFLELNLRSALLRRRKAFLPDLLRLQFDEICVTAFRGSDHLIGDKLIKSYKSTYLYNGC
jgi:hypothetical protein